MSWAELPWITAADRAGLELLTRELVDGYIEHAERCAVCKAGTVCQPLRDATQVVVDWRDGRELYRRALALDVLERPQEAA